MKLARMVMENFGIFKGIVDLDFHDKDIIGVLAEYANDKTRSNRSGKTLVMEAIKYNLIGTYRSKKVIDMIHEGEKVMSITNTYIDGDGKEYIIKRGCDHKNNSILELNWIQKAKETQQAISDLFGIDKSDFELTSFFKQGEINGFMDKSNAEKTEHMMKWLDNTHWKTREANAKADRDIIKKKLQENEIVQRTLEASLEVNESLQNELDLTQQEIDKKQDTRNELLQSIKEKREHISTRRQQIKNELSQLSSKESELKKLKSSMDRISELREEYKAVMQKLKTVEGKIDENVDCSKKTALVQKSATLLEKQRNLKNEIQKLSDNKGVCPILKTSCDSIKFDKNEKTRIEAEIESISTDIQKIKKTITIIEETEGAQDKIKSYENQIKIIKAKANEINQDEVKEKIKELESEIKGAKQVQHEDFNKIRIEIEKQEAELDELDSEISSATQKIGTLSHRIKESEKALEKIDEIAKRSQQLREQLEELNYIVVMFGKNGIPADEIDNSFIEVEENINYILQGLDCGLTISFSPDKEIDKWEPICHCGHQFIKNFKGGSCPECDSPRQKQRRDEITFKVLENGKEKDFSSDSGGGKTIISYAVRIALTILKRKQNQCKLNMLFLDEVDTALDSYFAAQLVSSIIKVLTKKLGYDQILMVSHKEEIKKSLPHILKVTRFENYSKADFIA